MVSLFWREHWVFSEALTTAILGTVSVAVTMVLLALVVLSPAFRFENLSLIHLYLLQPLIIALIFIAVAIPTAVYNHWVGKRIDFAHSMLASLATSIVGSVLLGLAGITYLYLFSMTMVAFTMSSTISMWGAYKLFPRQMGLAGARQRIYGYGGKRLF